jgi:hypothetical protein
VRSTLVLLQTTGKKQAAAAMATGFGSPRASFCTATPQAESPALRAHKKADRGQTRDRRTAREFQFPK